MYALSTPAADCGAACNRDIPADPSLRYQAFGPGACPPGSAVNDSSELLGLPYKNSKCSSDAYLPGKYASQGACAAPGNSDARACMAPTEHTRLSNPPCNLHSTGWNRWEWLCWNPQERAIIPFEWNTSYRIVVKDNHTPCIEEPLDQTGFMPDAGHGETVSTTDQGHWTNKSACSASTPVSYIGNSYNASAFSCTGMN